MDMVYKTLLKTKHQNFVCIVNIEGGTYRKALHEIQNLKGIRTEHNGMIYIYKGEFTTYFVMFL
jgi:hypothetical protein